MEQNRPAKKYEVIRKTKSAYVGLVEDGHHFVVVDVLNDDTAVVVGLDGSLKYLCYPEEYVVVTSAQELVDAENEKTHKRIEDIHRRIAEEKANGTYIDPLEMFYVRSKADKLNSEHK